MHTIDTEVAYLAGLLGVTTSVVLPLGRTGGGSTRLNPWSSIGGLWGIPI